MALHPVGPLPAAVYWRRRLVLLAVLLGLLLVARSCVTGEDGGTPTRTSSTGTPTGAPTPRATAPTPSATRAGIGTCPDRALTLAIRSDARQYPAGSTPRFTLTVTNKTGTACRRDLGGKHVELLVYSGQDRIWSSDDCGDTTGTSVQTLGAGKSLETTISWPRTRSRPGCEGAKPQAQPGTYYVRARVGTLRTSGAVFRLSD